jgi:hypothetical protein
LGPRLRPRRFCQGARAAGEDAESHRGHCPYGKGGRRILSGQLLVRVARAAAQGRVPGQGSGKRRQRHSHRAQNAGRVAWQHEDEHRLHSVPSDGDEGYPRVPVQLPQIQEFGRGVGLPRERRRHGGYDGQLARPGRPQARSGSPRQLDGPHRGGGDTAASPAEAARAGAERRPHLVGSLSPQCHGPRCRFNGPAQPHGECQRPRLRPPREERRLDGRGSIR